MHFDLQLFEHVGKVEAVAAKPGKHDAAHGVEVDLVCIAGSKILKLTAVFAVGEDNLAGIAKGLQTLTNADSATAGQSAKTV